MIKPKNQAEMKAYKESCIASYEQEIAEMSDTYPNIEDFYYSNHWGCWVLKFKNKEAQEFESKSEMIDWLLHNEEYHFPTT